MNPEGQGQDTVTSKVFWTVGFPAQLKWRDYENLTTPQHKLLTLASSCGKLKI